MSLHGIQDNRTQQTRENDVGEALTACSAKPIQLKIGELSGYAGIIVPRNGFNAEISNNNEI